jgi:FkbM family methyltransferase
MSSRAKSATGRIARRILSDSMLKSMVKSIEAIRSRLHPVDPLTVESRFSIIGSLENLARNNLQPGAVLDVGANVGDWTRAARPFFPEARFLMVEAQADKTDQLGKLAAGDKGIDFEICLLGAQNDEAVPFYKVTVGGGSGSSMFPEKTQFPRSTIRLPMRRLDDVVAAHHLPRPFLLKLDVEGAELQVLQGATNTLRMTDVILSEVSLLAYNNGAPLVTEVMQFLDAAGFVLYDISGGLRRASDKAMFRADLVFVRKDHPLRHDKPFW